MKKVNDRKRGARSVWMGFFVFSLLILLPRISTADPLDHWHLRNNPLPQGIGIDLHGVTWGNGTFMAVGDVGAIPTSPDGTTWSLRWTPQTFGLLSGVTWGNGTFVMVGWPSGMLLTSPDGTTWSRVLLPPGLGLYGVTWGNSTFVAVGYNGTILQSDPLLESGPPPTEVNPTEGTIGTDLTITGSDFGTKKGKVLVGRTPLVVLEWADGSIRGHLTKALTPGTYNVTIQPVEPKGAAPISAGSFMVKAPEIDLVDPNHGSTGGQISIHGRFFGTKKGKVALGYVSKGRPAKKSCKVLSWTMNPMTNEGKIEFVIPKGLLPGNYDLIIANGMNSATLTDGLAIE